MKLTAERLRDVLNYDPATGVFSWRKPISSHAIVGKSAGTRKPPKGYVCITVDRQRHYAHRLAWLWMTGDWPNGEVDHRNLTHDDNRWNNLRDASSSDNRCNTGRYRNNTSGFKGVYFHKARRKWHARISKHGRVHFLGYFENPVDAHAAYVEASSRIHGGFARTA